MDSIRHIAKFTSDIWRIHPFGEGNTRSTAVFIIKYLKSFGLSISNDVFAENSWYFRNALVRANYNDWSNDINATTYFLELFFENLLLGTNHELKNRYLHVDYKDYNKQESNLKILKCQNGTLDGTLNDTLDITLEELAVMNAIRANVHLTQKQFAEQTGLSERTIKRKTITLQEMGFIKRVNGKRNGHWEILQ